MNERVPGEDISDWFWSIVGRVGGDKQRLRSILWDLSEEENCRFHLEFKLATSVLIGEPFDAIIYESSGESEDGISDIASWVVSRGREYYEAILSNPEDIPRHVDVGDPSLLGHMMYKVFEEKFGKDLAGEDSAWP